MIGNASGMIDRSPCDRQQQPRPLAIILRRPPARVAPRRRETPPATASFARYWRRSFASVASRSTPSRAARRARSPRPRRSERATCAAVARAKTRSIGSTAMTASRSSASRSSTRMSAGSPTRERSRARRAVGEAPVGDDRGEPRSAFDHAVEAPAAMQEMAEPHLAHDVVVLVEGRARRRRGRRGSRA